MANRSGTANLPLHYGRVPKWLSARMATLGAAICEAVVMNEGKRGLLKRLSDPFWFQSFGCVLGMDWHSSGITTSVMGALKRGLRARQNELGIYVCGGRGKQSRKTPQELEELSVTLGLDGDSLVQSSKLTAKVDNVAVQDGYSLYLHSFVLSDEGDWVVIQQGMNDASRDARRYHWRSDNISSFIEEPHDAVIGPNVGSIVNLTDKRSKQARECTVYLTEEKPENVSTELKQILSHRHLQMPHHHEVKLTDVFIKRLHGVLHLAKESNKKDFESLLLTEGLGPRTMQALALISEVAYGAPSRFNDPARYAFAHGGKDGHPHPVPLHVYDETLKSLQGSLEKANVGQTDKLESFKQLDKQVRRIEQVVKGERLSDILDREWKQSPRYGGMTVLGKASKQVEQEVRGTKSKPSKKKLSKKKSNDKQLVLFG